MKSEQFTLSAIPRGHASKCLFLRAFFHLVERLSEKSTVQNYNLCTTDDSLA